MSKEYQIAKTALESLIAKARVHLYKPIQIAEILYRDRVSGGINLNQIETYRTSSRKWRDVVCIPFLGRTSTSSARYQDDLFQAHAIPPDVLSNLGIVNRKTEGGIEAFIYSRFYQRYQQLYSGLAHCQQTNFEAFELQTFLNLFWLERGLRRSIGQSL